jgi:hypothetical protein
MKVSTIHNFVPLSITIETQEELNILADALYELDLDDEDKYSEKAINVLRELRIELYDYHSTDNC